MSNRKNSEDPPEFPQGWDMEETMPDLNSQLIDSDETDPEPGEEY
jgi:hypothetical protein